MLQKLPTLVFIPGVAGQSARPEQIYCSPAAPSGSWQYICTTTDVSQWFAVGTSPSGLPIYAAGIAIPPGGVVLYVYDSQGILTNVLVRVCSSQWIPSGEPVQEPVCVTYPALPFIPSTPARVEEHTTMDWDAGANSIQQIDGDARVRFSMRQAVGVVCGFTTNRENITDRARMQHAFVFTTNASNQRRFQIIESGVTFGAVRTYIDDDVFEIRRVGTSVFYLHNNVVVYTSRTPSTGELSVGAAIFGPGDVI